MRNVSAVLRDIISEAWHEIWRAKLRSLLAILGITVGAGAITCLAGMHQVDRAFEAKARAYGWVSIAIPRIALDKDFQDPLARKPHLTREELTLEDAEAIRQQCPSVESVVIQDAPSSVTCKAGRRSAFAVCTGTSAHSATEREARGEWQSLSAGRFFAPEEIADREHVVVINAPLRKALFGDEPLAGKILRINGYKYAIIGAVRDQNEIDDSVLIPYTCVEQLKLAHTRWFFQARPKRHAWKRAVRDIDAVLVKRLGNPGQSFVAVDNPLSESDDRSILSFMGLLGFLTLLSTGVATSNKTYMDVLERLDQFALRRALLNLA